MVVAGSLGFKYKAERSSDAVPTRRVIWRTGQIYIYSFLSLFFPRAAYTKITGGRGS